MLIFFMWNAIQSPFSAFIIVNLVVKLHIHADILHGGPVPLLWGQFVFFYLVNVGKVYSLWFLELHKHILGFDCLDFLETLIAFSVFPLSSDEFYKAVSIVADVLPHSRNSYTFFVFLT